MIVFQGRGICAKDEPILIKMDDRKIGSIYQCLRIANAKSLLLGRYAYALTNVSSIDVHHAPQVFEKLSRTKPPNFRCCYHHVRIAFERTSQNGETIEFFLRREAIVIIFIMFDSNFE